MIDALFDLAHEAHEACTVDGAFSPREVAEDFVRRVQELEGSGRAEPPDFLRRMMVDGASKWLADFRRRSMIPAKTPKGGALVDLPAFAGVRGDDGPKQMAFFAMPLPVLVAHRRKLKTGRDTVSREISIIDALIAAMKADPKLETAGDAFRKLGLAA